MGRTLRQIAEHLRQNGFDVRQHGPDDLAIHSVATLEQAGPGQISFLANRKYTKLLERTSASAVLLPSKGAAPDGVAQLRVNDPYYALPFVIEFVHGRREHPFTGVSDRACIDPTATVGANAAIAHDVTICKDAAVGANAVIYPGCFIGPRCRIGDDVLLFPNVVIYEGCVLGNRVTIHAGTVVGNDGFGYATHEGVHHKIPQIGNVIVEDDVELGSNCSIDRGGLDSTVIGRGSKFSNLIAIGHGTKIGPHCLLVAQVGIAGSTKLGHHVTLGGQVGVVGHIQIGSQVTVGAKAGVTHDVQDNQTLLGQPAVNIGNARRQMMSISKLPQMRQQLRQLQQQVAALQQQIERLSAGRGGGDEK